MKPITIRIAGPDEKFPGAYIVEQDGTFNDGLGWDEMLGQVVSLTFQSIADRIRRWGGPRGSLYPMKTAEEWAAEEAARESRRAARPAAASDEDSTC